MSIFDRFRARKNLPLELDVKFPIENPEIVFKVDRFSVAEFNEATIDAEGQLARRGVKKTDPDFVDNYSQAICYELAKYIKRHIKNWVHTPKEGEPEPFNPGALELFWNNLTVQEKTEIGLSYYAAEQKLLAEKKSNALPTPQSES